MGSLWSKERKMDPLYQDAVHALKILSELDSMRKENLICDCCITVERKVFHVHRNVLAANSEYFKDIFTKQGSNIENIEINNVDPDDVRECIDFMYRNEAVITQRNIVSLKELSKTFKLHELTERCEQFSESGVNSDNNWAQKEDNVKREKLDKEKNDLDIASTSASSLSSSSHNIDYKAEWEEKLKWIKQDVKERKVHLTQVLENIRIRELSFDFVISVICKEQQLIKQVKGARDLVANSLLSNREVLKSNITMTNLLTLKAFSKTYRGPNHQEVKFIIDIFLQENIEEIVEKDLFKSLEKDEVVSLLKKMKSGRKLEEIKWKAALSWLKYYNRRSNFAELLTPIRFDKLSKEFVRSSVLSEGIVKDSVEIKRMIMDLLFDAVPKTSSTPQKKRKLDIKKFPSQVDVGIPGSLKVATSCKELITQGHTKQSTKNAASPAESTSNVVSPKKVSQIIDMQLQELYKGIGCGKMTLVDEELYLLSGNTLFQMKFNEALEISAKLPVTTMNKQPSASARVAVLNQLIYVIEENVMSCYDLNTKTWTHGLPGCKLANGFCSTACGPYLYAMGGKRGGDRAVRFDPLMGQWSDIARMAKRRYGAAATALNGMVYVMGGFEKEPHNSVEYYNRYYNRWESSISMKEHRRYFNAFVFEGNIFALGGNSKNPVEVRNKLTGVWDILKCEGDFNTGAS